MQLLALLNTNRNLKPIDDGTRALPFAPEFECDPSGATIPCFEHECPLTRRTDGRVGGQLEFRTLGIENLVVDVLKRPAVSSGRCFIEANQDRLIQLGVDS